MQEFQEGWQKLSFSHQCVFLLFFKSQVKCHTPGEGYHYYLSMFKYITIVQAGEVDYNDIFFKYKLFRGYDNYHFSIGYFLLLSKTPISNPCTCCTYFSRTNEQQ